MGAEIEAALRRAKLSGKDIQQRCLAAAVVAEDKDLFALSDEHIDAVEHGLAVEGFAELFGCDNIVAADCARLEGKVYGCAVPLRLDKRCTESVRLLLLGGGGHIVTLLIPTLLLLDDALNTFDLALRAHIAPALKLPCRAAKLYMP